MSRYQVSADDDRDVVDTLTHAVAKFTNTVSARQAIKLLDAGARRDQWVWS